MENAYITFSLKHKMEQKSNRKFSSEHKQKEANTSQHLKYDWMNIYSLKKFLVQN